MDAKEMALQYYPKLWSMERLNALVAAGKLSQEDVDAIKEEAAQRGDT